MYNIYKVNHITYLKSFFKKYGRNNIIVLIVININLNITNKNMILSFIKNKAKQFKKIYFLVCLFDEQDVEYIVKKFKIKRHDIPYITYVYNNIEQLINVTSVTTIKPLKESFSAFEEYYND